MHILSILFFCFAASSDSLVIGLSYGSKAIRINFWSNFLVACMSCIGTFLAMIFGKGLSSSMSQNYTDSIGSILLIIFGIYMLVNSAREHNKSIAINDRSAKNYYDYIDHPELLDRDNSKEIEIKEAIVLGGILSLNNIGIGVGASISGLNIYLTPILSLSFSLLFIKLGFWIGNKIISRKISKYSEYISAVIILFLGLYELFI